MIQKIKKLRLKVFMNKPLLIVATIVATSLASMGVVYAVDYNAQIESLQSQISQYESQANALQSQGDTLQSKLDTITAEKNALQAAIDINTVKVNQLTIEISDNEVKLERQKKTIGKTIAQIYVNSSTSPIEMLASSKSVGEYVSQQEVRNSVRNQMKIAMDEVKRLRQELVDQKKSVEDLIATQNTQKGQVAVKEAEQADLVTKTRGEEAAYRAVADSLQAQKAAAESALAASLNSGSYKISPAGYVNSGNIVGAVGSTGLSSGPHLHLEVRQGGSRQNPENYIKSQPINMPPGYISQSYNNYDPFYIGGRHPGTDYATNSGAPIFAIDSGNMYRGCSDQMLGTSNNAYGYVAIVEHSNGAISVYAHMSGGPAACDYNTYY